MPAQSTMSQAAPLLAFIRTHESRDNYNVVWGGIKQQHWPRKSLTAMTIREVLAWQDSIDHLYRSEASGAYQILEDTLREIYPQAGLTLDDLFNQVNQDKLAVALLKRRGLTKYLRGEILAETFALAVAKEWASMPVVSGKNKGKSYYDGDGLNSTRVPVDDFMAAILAVKHEKIKPVPMPENFFQWLLALFFGRTK